MFWLMMMMLIMMLLFAMILTVPIVAVMSMSTSTAHHVKHVVLNIVRCKQGGFVGALLIVKMK